MIFVIAQWITMDAAQALEFLATRDALEPVLRLWCDTHEDFSYNGKYYTNVSAMALIAVLKSGDERLYEITVDGDEIYDVKGIRTRAVSAVKPQRFQQVPVVAKIAKLLIREFGSLLEDAKVREGGGDEEYDVEEVRFLSTTLPSRPALLGPSAAVSLPCSILTTTLPSGLFRTMTTTHGKTRTTCPLSPRRARLPLPSSSISPRP